MFPFLSGTVPILGCALFCCKARRSGRARKKCRGKHETQSIVFPHFLSALPLPKCFTTEQSTVRQVSSPEESSHYVAHEDVHFQYRRKLSTDYSSMSNEVVVWLTFEHFYKASPHKQRQLNW